MTDVEQLRLAGEIGGRTVQIIETGAVEIEVYDPAPLEPEQVRVRTVMSAISPGTEMTYLGRDASNVQLHKRWNPGLRLFEDGGRGVDYPIVFGYRAAGVVVESRSPSVGTGTRLYGNWRHTEFLSMPAARAVTQTLPDGLGWDDAIDIGQMGPICANAVAFGERAVRDRPAVVFGAGPIGLLTAQIVRASGASAVHVVDRIPARVEIARGLGLDGVSAGGETDVIRDLKSRYGADGIPVAWECTGSTLALGDAIRVVARQGAVIAVGFYQGEARGLVLGDEFHHNAVRIISAQIGNPHPGFDRPGLQRRTLELVESGQLILGGLPRLTLPVEDAAAGFEALRRPAEVLQVALSYD